MTTFFLRYAVSFALIICIGYTEAKSADAAPGHGENPASAEPPKGPHSGKMFEKNGFAVEVTIYEPDIPPQSRVYVYENNRPIDPSQVELVTELHRIDRVDTIQYVKQEDYLQGDRVVEEPHSFDVKLKAKYRGNQYFWEYSSYEGRTRLSEEAIKSAGIELERVSGATISSWLTLNGRITPDKTRVSSLAARFPGVVREIRKFPGSRVEKGEVLASVEANESLRTYELLAPRAGEVLDLSTSVGELVGADSPIITVGDISSVWVELTVPKGDFPKLRPGQKVQIRTDDDGEPAEGEITYLAPLADRETQTRVARAEVKNADRLLSPGLFVDAKVQIEERQVPVAIRAEALQKFREWDVVFKRVGENFEIAILELGDRDGDWLEVKQGLSPNAEYVTKNSFVVKADVMKSGASHDH